MKLVNLRLHYSRAGQWLSGRRTVWLLIGLGGLVPAFGAAQYGGKVSSKDSTPTLRAVGVLEWTGTPGKPKFCRLVPVSIFDGEKLQDAGLYLSRPAPLALQTEVEYQLKQNGHTIGIFDIKSAGQEQGSWVGFGNWRPVPHPKPAFATVAPDFDAEDDDKPVLHRKKHAADNPVENSKTPGQDSGRPTLHKPSSGSSAPDTSGEDTSGGSGSVDPDRPTLKKPKSQPQQQPVDDGGHVSSVPGVTDPDRPHLIRGQVNGISHKVVPTLMGMPADMQQAVAVSDPTDRPEHLWTYTWANPADEGKMKASLEDIARTALGLNAAAATPATATHHASSHTSSRKPAKPAAPTAPPPLQDENFRVFELSYGAGATLVLTADTGGPLAQEKFVTLIAQPDLYGNVLVLFKYVTDGAHLDERPRMRLVDAVDAMADNRGELLFELRGDSSRQFALYRVLRGSAVKLFVSGGAFWGSTGGE